MCEVVLGKEYSQKLSFLYAILIRHVLAQPGVRKVEAGAPWAVGSATRARNYCGVHIVTNFENLCTNICLLKPDKNRTVKTQKLAITNNA